MRALDFGLGSARKLRSRDRVVYRRNGVNAARLVEQSRKGWLNKAEEERAPERPHSPSFIP
jgi:hypothetical protein